MSSRAAASGSARTTPWGSQTRLRLSEALRLGRFGRPNDVRTSVRTPRDQPITHFVLERGHLWGRKEVTVPIGAVARVESDVVHVALSKNEVGGLPAVRVGQGTAAGGVSSVFGRSAAGAVRCPPGSRHT